MAPLLAVPLGGSARQHRHGQPLPRDPLEGVLNPTTACLKRGAAPSQVVLESSALMELFLALVNA